MATLPYPDVSTLQLVGELLTLAVLFVLREFASGALKKAGEEFWIWARCRCSGRQGARSEVITQQLDAFLAPGLALRNGRRRYSAMEASGRDTRSPSLRSCRT